jgi:uncharacterized protein
MAHELGHYVQKLVGTTERVQAAEQRDSSHANQYSIRLELQADCYAGVWVHSGERRHLVQDSDTAQSMAAAAAVGGDRLQKMARGYVNPESFSHGSSEQRTAWFKRGLDSGRMPDCDTFHQEIWLASNSPIPAHRLAPSYQFL